MPQVAAAVASLDPAHVASALRDGGRVAISVDVHDHELACPRDHARDVPARGPDPPSARREAELLAAARAFEPYIAGETLALSVAYDADAGEAAPSKAAR